MHSHQQFPSIIHKCITHLYFIFCDICAHILCSLFNDVFVGFPLVYHGLYVKYRTRFLHNKNMKYLCVIYLLIWNKCPLAGTFSECWREKRMAPWVKRNEAVTSMKRWWLRWGIESRWALQRNLRSLGLTWSRVSPVARFSGWESLSFLKDEYSSYSLKNRL